MNKIKGLGACGAALLLACGWSVAQEKAAAPHGDMATASKPAKAAKAPALSAAATIKKATSAAPADIGKGAGVMGMVDGNMKELRPSSNGWMCMLNPVGDSMCMDKTWQAWGEAWMNKKDPPKPTSVGVTYMLNGDKGASNTDPFATNPTPDNHWVVSGPHVMLLPTDASQLESYPTDWTKGGPWVMWKGTPYAHIMVPTTAMPAAKGAAKK